MSGYSLREKLSLISWYYKDKITRRLKLSDPKAWNPAIWNLYGASDTAAGVKVTEANADTTSAVFAAIKIISGDISTLPIHLYRKQSNGKRKVVNDHSSLQILKHKACQDPLLPAINFREATMSHILGWGNMYAEKITNSIGNVTELFPITPDRVTPRWINKSLWYEIDVDSQPVMMPQEKILHIAGLGFNGFVGQSVISKASESIGLTMAQEKFGGRFFGSNTNIGGVIKTPRAMSDKAQKNIKRSLENYQGLTASHRWMVLEHGIEIEKLGFAPDESQFLQSRQFQISEIARWFNMPPHKLKDLTRSTFSNIEEQETEYVISCLVPWLTKIEQNL